MEEENIKKYGWLGSVARVMSREFKLVLRDEAVIIFFIVLSLVYPPLYSLIYNTEVAREEPVVIVDDCRSPLSREFSQRLDASPEVHVKAYASTMEQAREMMALKQCYGIYYFPPEFEDDARGSKQGHVSLYCDMSVMMRYKAMLTALTNVQMETCTELQGEKVANIIDLGGGIVESRQVPLGNTSMGIGSAVLPFILVFVLQQSMLLGISMLHAGGMGRRRRNLGIDRLEIKALPGAMLIGKTLAYIVIYTIPVIFALYIIPLIFHFPVRGNLLEILFLAVPFLIASSMFGLTMRVFVNNREGVFLIIAFTSLIFVFLSGVSWPRFLMEDYWIAMGDIIPGYWASTAFVRMQVNGASLSQVSGMYYNLWILAAVWFVIAYLVELLVLRPRYKAMKLQAELDPKALTNRILYEMGDDELINAEQRLSREGTSSAEAAR